MQFECLHFKSIEIDDDLIRFVEQYKSYSFLVIESFKIKKK